MKYKEVKCNLFEVRDSYYAHCISSDYALGAGIAVQFQKKFHLKNKLSDIGSNIYPDCIFVDGVFNLVTKDKYWHKPTYQSLTKSLELMRDMIINEENNFIKNKIAMPKIGCGLDRLQWGRVREIINEIFKDTDIEITVCNL